MQATIIHLNKHVYWNNAKKASPSPATAHSKSISYLDIPAEMCLDKMFYPSECKLFQQRMNLIQGQEQVCLDSE